MNFQVKLQNIIQNNNSLVCIGLDQSDLEFNKRIIDHTVEYVCAYKLNSAFYEAAGSKGAQSLQDAADYLKRKYPKVPIILDAKRADVPNTAKEYAKAAYETMGADAATVLPYIGRDSLEPFFAYEDKLTIIIFKTSNPDSGTFQNMLVNDTPLYLKIAVEVKSWNKDNLGVFVGATYPQEMRKLREIFPDNIFLSAGIGAQGASVQAIVKAGIDKNGGNIMFNASRSIIFDKDPKSAAKKLRDEINKYR